MTRKEYEEKYPEFQTRFIAFCYDRNTKRFKKNYLFMAWIDKMVEEYKKATGYKTIHDQDDFINFIWSQVEK